MTISWGGGGTLAVLTLMAPLQPYELLIVVPWRLFKVKCTGKLVTSTRGGGVLYGDMCLMADNNAGVCNWGGCREIGVEVVRAHASDMVWPGKTGDYTGWLNDKFGLVQVAESKLADKFSLHAIQTLVCGAGAVSDLSSSILSISTCLLVFFVPTLHFLLAFRPLSLGMLSARSCQMLHEVFLEDLTHCKYYSSTPMSSAAAMHCWHKLGLLYTKQLQWNAIPFN